jgi:hypothetical protein
MSETKKAETLTDAHRAQGWEPSDEPESGLVRVEGEWSLFALPPGHYGEEVTQRWIWLAYFDGDEIRQGEADTLSAAIDAAEKASGVAEVDALRARVAELEKALIARMCAGVGHGHWDSTGRRGAGCPLCLAQQEANDTARSVLKGGALPLSAD